MSLVVDVCLHAGVYKPTLINRVIPCERSCRGLGQSCVWLSWFDQGCFSLEISARSTRIQVRPETNSSFCTTPNDSNQGIPKPSISCVDYSSGETMRVYPSKPDFTLYGKEPFENCRSCELTATRLCAEMPRATGAYIQGRGREIAQARSVPLQPCARCGMEGYS